MTMKSHLNLIYLYDGTLSFYLVARTFGSVLLTSRFYNKNRLHGKKIPMDAASMSRCTIGAYLMLHLEFWT